MKTIPSPKLCKAVSKEGRAKCVRWLRHPGRHLFAEFPLVASDSAS